MNDWTQKRDAGTDEAPARRRSNAMSKIRLLKIWLCAGMLFAFLSGGTTSWLLNRVLEPVQALPDSPESSDEYVRRFVAEFGLDDEQAKSLGRVVNEWKDERVRLVDRFKPEFTRLNERYEERIIDLLTPEQRSLYTGGE